MIHIDIDIQDEQEAARVLALLNREYISYRVGNTKTIKPEEKEKARESGMRGGEMPYLEEMLNCVKEGRDRKLPFREE